LAAAANGPYVISGPQFLDSINYPTVDIDYACLLRDKDATNMSKIVVNADWEQSDDNGLTWEACLTTEHITIEAQLYGADVAGAVWNPTSYGSYIDSSRQAYWDSEPADPEYINRIHLAITQKAGTTEGALVYMASRSETWPGYGTIEIFEDEYAWRFTPQAPVYAMSIDWKLTLLSGRAAGHFEFIFYCEEGTDNATQMKLQRSSDYNPAYTPGITDVGSPATIAVGGYLTLSGPTGTWVAGDVYMNFYSQDLGGIHKMRLERIDWEDGSGTVTIWTRYETRALINYVELYNICPW